MWIVVKSKSRKITGRRILTWQHGREEMVAGTIKRYTLSREVIIN